MATNDGGKPSSAVYIEQFQPEDELRILRAIVAREAAMDELLDVCCALELQHVNKSSVLQQILDVRVLSLRVIEAIAAWRRRMVTKKPFLWRQQVHYAVKMVHDLDFLSKSRVVTLAMDGLRLPKRNPFTTVGGLDQNLWLMTEAQQPEEDDLPLLLDPASYAPDASCLELPTKMRLAECFIMYEERRFGRLTKVQLKEVDPRMKKLVHHETEFNSKAKKTE